MTASWPHTLFRPRGQEWSIQGSTQDGGRPQVGSTPQRITFGGGGLNIAKLNDIHLNSREQMATWRALSLQLDNGSAPIIVPRCSRRSSPLLPAARRSPPVPHSDGTYFSDDTGYVSDVTGSFIKQNAAFRDTTLKVRLVGGRPLIGGEAFSILHPNAGWRIYWVAAILSATAVTDGFDYELSFRTPLREQVYEGDQVEWQLPRCVMRLADPNGMTLLEDLGRFADLSVAFVEDFSVFGADAGF